MEVSRGSTTTDLYLKLSRRIIQAPQAPFPGAECRGTATEYHSRFGNNRAQNPVSKVYNETPVFKSIFFVLSSRITAAAWYGAALNGNFGCELKTAIRVRIRVSTFSRLCRTDIRPLLTYRGSKYA